MLAKKGYNIIVDKEYQSIIKGGNNNLVVYISDTDHTLTKKIDIFVAFDQFAIDKNNPIYDCKYIEDLSTIKGPQKNIIAFGIGAKALGIPQNEAEEQLKTTFKDKFIPAHSEALQQGYSFDNEMPTPHDCSKSV